MSRREKKSRRTFSVGDVRRRTGRKRVVVVPEGTTEQNYLTELHIRRWSHALSIEFSPQRGSSQFKGKGRKKNGPADITYLIRYAKSCEDGETPVWIVCDGDRRTKEIERELDSLRKNAPVSAAISTPCIEFWFLCILGKAPRVATASEAVKELRKLLPSYTKPEVPRNVLDHSKNAVQLALAGCPNVGTKSGWPPSTSSTMPLLIKELDALAGVE